MANKALFVFLIVVVVFVTSCSVYIPQPASVPLLSEKHEFQADAGATMFLGGTISAAYAPFENIGTHVYASLHPGNSAYVQGSVGFWSKSEADVNFELYGGMGLGQGINSLDNDFNTSLNTKYKLYFAQFNVGQTNRSSAHIDYGFGLKVGQFDAQVNYLNDNLDIQKGRNGSVLFEPQAFMRLGGERIKVGFQANTCVLFNPNQDNAHLYYIPFNMGISINYRIPGNKK
jgi:hypothetical protein